MRGRVKTVTPPPSTPHSASLSAARGSTLSRASVPTVVCGHRPIRRSDARGSTPEVTSRRSCTMPPIGGIVVEAPHPTPAARETGVRSRS